MKKVNVHLSDQARVPTIAANRDVLRHEWDSLVADECEGKGIEAVANHCSHAPRRNRTNPRVSVGVRSYDSF